MKRIGLLSLVLMFTGATACAQESNNAPEPYQAGVHYTVLEQKPGQETSGDKIEVLEAFSYLCTHCNTFEPYIHHWVENAPESVEFTRVPVVFGRRPWELYARAYVAADMMGAAEQSHQAMFDAIWKERRDMRSLEDLADFYAEHGVDKDAFLATVSSFAVDARLRREQRMVQEYAISGTPGVVINGKYRVSGSGLPGYDAFIDVINFLVEKESASMAEASAASAE